MVSRTLVLDVEADGLYREATRLWCICVGDPITGEHWEFGPEEIDHALTLLATGGTLVGHNVGYDLSVLAKLKGWSPLASQVVRDTMLWAKVVHPDRANEDFQSGKQAVISLAGAHSLKSWGIRLGVHKLEYAGGFAAFTPEMLTYCAADVQVTCSLYRYLADKEVSPEALELEHQFAVETERMTQHGIKFDVVGAQKLLDDLESCSAKIAQRLRQEVPARVTEMKTPAWWRVDWPNGSVGVYDTKTEADADRRLAGIKPKQWRLTKGPPKLEVEEFNPGSRKQIREVLYQRHGWLSPKLTDKGEELLKAGQKYESLAPEYGSVSEDVLRGLPFKEADTLADFLLIEKMVGMVARGDNSWVKCTDEDGRIRHRIDSVGCATFRVAHSRINASQVPAAHIDKATGKPLLGLPGRYGWESRSLFVASEGCLLVGTDLSGIEACLLAHYLYPYDGGKYVDQVRNGDIHQQNVDAFREYAGYTISRGDSKGIFYGTNYGAGDKKLGKVAVEVCEEAKIEYKGLFRYYQRSEDALKASESAFRKIGRNIRQALEKGITGFDKLLADVKKAASRGYLKVLDGRKVPVRYEHAAINTLLQSAGAVVAKRWAVVAFQDCREMALDFHPLLFSHDELQSEVLVDHVSLYTDTVLAAIPKAGEHYKLHIPLSGEAKRGRTWAETH